MATQRKKTGTGENIAERRAKVWELRKAGKTVRQIAKELKASKTTIADDLKKGFEEYRTHENADKEQYISLELDRLDALTAVLWPQAQVGDNAAIDRLLKILERRAKLLGLDAPSKQEVTGADGGPIAHMNLSPDQVKRMALEVLNDQSSGLCP